LGKKAEMRVGDLAEEEFRSGIDDFNAHFVQLRRVC
jgi:hypothetical protein